MKGEGGELDDKKRIEGGNTGLQNLIVLSNISDIDSLKRVRFEIKQNNPD